MTVSMVLLDRPIALPEREIERELQNRFPELGASLIDGESDETTATLNLDGGTVILGNMPGPLPWSDFEGLCKTSTLWKNAEDDIKKHRAYLVVTLSSELDKVEQAIRLTKATAAALTATDAAIGVYWVNAPLIAPKEIFLDFTTGILPRRPPIHIWVDVQVGWKDEGASYGYTRGMEALGFKEIEVPTSPERPHEPRERLHDLAVYLIMNGSIIRHGDTIGRNTREKIQVVFSNSAFGHKNRVMRLDYELFKPKPWWQFW